MRFLLFFLILFYGVEAEIRIDSILTIINKNDLNQLSKFLTLEKTSLEISTDSLQVAKSFYSSRQCVFLLEKFNSFYTFKRILEKKIQSENETYNLDVLYSVFDTSKKSYIQFRINCNILNQNNKLTINQLIITQSEN